MPLSLDVHTWYYQSLPTKYAFSAVRINMLSNKIRNNIAMVN